MSDEALRAVVVGAGWAGEGHTLAMRHCGVEVAAICARNPDVVRAVAERLGVPAASTDWRATIRAVRPSIVCIATPAVLRGEVVEEAVAARAHVFCDKPLALDGREAGRLHALVERARVKHGYAATFCYDPSVAWMAELVREGRIGRLLEMEVSDRSGGRPPSPVPWSWMLDPAQGGGRLQQGFTHTLATLTRVCGLPLRRAVGEARFAPVRAVVAAPLHDIREMFSARLTAEDVAGREKRDGRLESAYRALLGFGEEGREVLASVVVNTSTPVNWPDERIRLFGEAGTLLARDMGTGVYEVSLREPDAGRAEPLPVPDRLKRLVSMDQSEVVQSRWNAMARDFVADVRGRAHEPYPTFLDGWRYQVAIDAILRGGGWTEVPGPAAAGALSA